MIHQYMQVELVFHGKLWKVRVLTPVQQFNSATAPSTLTVACAPTSFYCGSRRTYRELGPNLQKKKAMVPHALLQSEHTI